MEAAARGVGMQGSTVRERAVHLLRPAPSITTGSTSPATSYSDMFHAPFASRASEDGVRARTVRERGRCASEEGVARQTRGAERVGEGAERVGEGVVG